MAQKHDNPRACGVDRGLHRSPDMTTRTSAFLTLLWLTLVFDLPASRAAAQATAGTGGLAGQATGGITWFLNKVGAEPYVDTSYRTPINKEQCDAKALLTFTLTGIPQGNKYLETWAGTMCDQANRQTRVDAIPCVYVDSKEQDPVTTQDTNFQVSVEQMCLQGDGAREYFVLPTNTVNTTAAVTPFAHVTLQIDTDPPSAPTSVQGGSGETEIPVTWTQPTDAYYYWVVVDTTAGTATPDAGMGVAAEDSGAAPSGGAGDGTGGGGTGGSGGAAGNKGGSGSSGSAGSAPTGPFDNGGPLCPSRFLIAGSKFNPKDKLPAGVFAKFIDKKVSSTTFTGSEIGSKLAAVAVISDDLAKNNSVLSNISCLQVVETNGFWEKYKATGGDAEQGCVCSTPGAGKRGTSKTLLPWLAGLLGIVGFWRTRRRR
jgi:MYXO-CTERM domain-containing protein